MTEQRQVARDRQTSKRTRNGSPAGTRLTEKQKDVMRKVVQRRKQVYEELAKH